MTPQDRIRQIQAETVTLPPKSKSLKLSEAAALLEKARSLHVELLQIQEANPHLASFISPVVKKLVEYEDELEAPAPEAPPPPAPEAPKDTPTKDEPKVDGEGMKPDEAEAILDKAIDCLKKAGEEGCASDLERVKAEIEEVDDTGVEDLPKDDDFDIDAEAPPVDGPEALESKASKRDFIEAYHNLRSRYVRLSGASSKLLAAFKSLNESNSNKSEAKALREAQTKAANCEEAAREIAAAYNAEAIELGSHIFELRKPELWAQHKADLQKCRVWEDFKNRTAKILAEAAKETPVTAPNKDAVTENKPSGDKPQSGAETKTQALTEEKSKTEEEETHPMVEAILRSRTRGSAVYG